MTKLLAVMRRGDIVELATRAKVLPQIVSDVIRGRRNLAAYPLLSKAIEEFMIKREQELLVQVMLDEKLNKMLSKLNLNPPTEEEVKFGGRRKTQVEIDRMNRKTLGEFIAYHKLNISTKDIRDMELQDLRDEVWDKYSEDREEKGFLDALLG